MRTHAQPEGVAVDCGGVVTRKTFLGNNMPTTIIDNSSTMLVLMLVLVLRITRNAYYNE